MFLSLPTSKWELGISVFLVSSSIGTFLSFLMQVSNLRNWETSLGFFLERVLKIKYS